MVGQPVEDGADQFVGVISVGEEMVGPRDRMQSCGPGFGQCLGLVVSNYGVGSGLYHQHGSVESGCGCGHIVAVQIVKEIPPNVHRSRPDLHLGLTVGTDLFKGVRIE